MRNKRFNRAEVNAGSMADIAFLLLIFFLVTTTISAEKGITMMLPPHQEDPPEFDVNERNILKILVNSQDQLMIENELASHSVIKEKVKEFVSNNKLNPNLSDSPEKAIVSIKTDRGTNYEAYINILDDVKRAYHELRANHLGISLDAYLALKPKNADEKALIDQAKQAFPMQISDAEPTNFAK